MRYALQSERKSCKKAGTIGKGKADEMDFWTKEEYLKFIECVKDKPISYYAFQILYWCGIREGELLARHQQILTLRIRNFISQSLISISMVKISSQILRRKRAEGML